jgi:hypothetical protein
MIMFCRSISCFTNLLLGSKPPVFKHPRASLWCSSDERVLVKKTWGEKVAQWTYPIPKPFTVAILTGDVQVHTDEVDVDGADVLRFRDPPGGDKLVSLLALHELRTQALVVGLELKRKN